jgi:hypothetical protein
MRKVDPLFAYLSILAVIQPARIQDIDASAMSIVGDEFGRWLLDRQLLRQAHEAAREGGFVIAVRRGVYFLAPKGRLIVRRAGLSESIDNSRLFLMKAQRRRYR